jgi:hypothetical protein
MDNWNQTAFTKPTPKKTAKQPQNFVEALKSIGGYTVQSASNDLIKPISSDMVNAFSGNRTSWSGGESSPAPQEWRKDWLPPEEIQKEAARRERLREVQALPIYDRQAEQTKRAIEALQKELALLAKDITTLDLSTQKAITEAVVNPGAYHVSFFEKLRAFVILMRKQIADSRNWLDASYARKNAKNVYWGGVNKSGTKYLLSSERYMATSAG